MMNQMLDTTPNITTLSQGDPAAPPAPVGAPARPENETSPSELRPDHDPVPPPSNPAPPVFPQAKGESDRAFEAFRVYWELGPRRRYAAVCKQVGASERTIRRWAVDFDWRNRIKSCAAQCAEQHLQTEIAVEREEVLDTAARAAALRDRQYALAEALLDAAERYLERLEGDDLDLMSFGDACKALAVASRLGERAAHRPAEDAAAPARTLRDQLSALLDQAYADPARPAAPTPPRDTDVPTSP